MKNQRLVNIVNFKNSKKKAAKYTKVNIILYTLLYVPQGFVLEKRVGNAVKTHDSRQVTQEPEIKLFIIYLELLIIFLHANFFVSH